MKKIGNGICVALAFLFLGIGVLGAIMPILPTTPFMLVSAGLFAKGSKRFHRWFLGTRWYKVYLEQAVKHKRMTGKAKKKTMVILGVLFAVGFWMCPVWYGRMLIAVVAAGHFYYFLFRIKTVGENAEAEEQMVLETVKTAKN